MMVCPKEVYKTANLLIDEYGEFAPAGAFIKADQMADRGDDQARDTWLKIARAAEEILSPDVPMGSSVH